MTENFYKVEIFIPKNIKNEENLKIILVNEIYKIACIFYETIGEQGEGGQNTKFLYGNGHHMAQDLAKKAEEIWDNHSNSK